MASCHYVKVKLLYGDKYGENKLTFILLGSPSLDKFLVAVKCKHILSLSPKLLVCAGINCAILKSFEAFPF